MPTDTKITPAADSVPTDELARPIVRSVTLLRRYLKPGQRVVLVWNRNWQPGVPRERTDAGIVRERAEILTVDRAQRNAVAFLSARERSSAKPRPGWHYFAKAAEYVFDEDGFDLVAPEIFGDHRAADDRLVSRYEWIRYPAGSRTPPACQVIRRKFVRAGTLNAATGVVTPGRNYWVNEPCGYWNDVDPETRMCRGCATGWELPFNFRIK